MEVVCRKLLYRSVIGTLASLLTCYITITLIYQISVQLAVKHVFSIAVYIYPRRISKISRSSQIKSFPSVSLGVTAKNVLRIVRDLISRYKVYIPFITTVKRSNVDA